VIVSKKLPANDELRPEVKQKAANAGEPDFRTTFDNIKESGKDLKFVVYETQVSSFRQLEAAINNAVKANKGRPFSRIFLISHAGGEKSGPSAKLSDTSRLSYNSTPLPNHSATEKLPPYLADAFNRALSPGGILVLASCGYYYESKLNDYRKLWLANLQGWASTIGHPVYASLGKAEPNRSTGADTYKNGDRDPIPFFGVTPDGTSLPFSGPKDANGNPLP
jgi:hypothetical protein